MKRILLSMLLTGVVAVASDGTAPYKSGLKLAPQADKIYAQECARCHGKDAKDTTFKGGSGVKFAAIAGTDAGQLAQTLKEYRGGIKSKDYQSVNKYGYGGLMKTVMADLSWEEIDAVADYVSGLK
jgi:cytochrome c553